MTREQWLQGEIAMIKSGGTMRQRCTMSTPDRIALGFCLGDVPDDRAHRCLDTCSPACSADKKRLRRWESAKGKCRKCGHGLPRERKPKAVKVLEPIPDSGNVDGTDGR